MKLPPTIGWSRRAKARHGFTLAEALAAMAFLAIVIPVSVQALRVANFAGQVADRKAAAARVAERLLNELIVTGQWKQAASGGVIEEDVRQYRWRVRNETWEKDTLRLVSVDLTYMVQGQDFDVHLSTVVDSATQ